MVDYKEEQAQERLSYLIVNNMSNIKGVSFDGENLYPEIIVECKNSAQLENDLLKDFSRNNFDVDMVEIENTDQNEYDELRLIFDLTLWNNSKMETLFTILEDLLLK